MNYIIKSVITTVITFYFIALGQTLYNSGYKWIGCINFMIGGLILYILSLDYHHKNEKLQEKGK